MSGDSASPFSWHLEMEAAWNHLVLIIRQFNTLIFKIGLKLRFHAWLASLLILDTAAR